MAIDDMTYSFGPRTNYTAAAIRALDATHQSQAILAGEAYGGGSYASIDELLTGLQQAMDQDEIDLDHYEIRREGEARFEMWVVASDNGLVFPLGDAQPTSVHCSQSNFWSVDDEDPDAIELAEALNAVVPF